MTAAPVADLGKHSMFDSLKGPWDRETAIAFLEASTCPIRLACTAADGYPRVASLWYQYGDEALHCVTHRDSALAALLRQDARVGFEISGDAPPYFGLRGQGDAQLAPLDDVQLLESLLQRYLGGTQSRLGRWLLSRAQEELWICIRPTRLFSWDYRERMADTVSDATTEASKQVVLDFINASNRGDMDTCFALLADDLVWTDVGTTPFAGRYEGKQAVLAELIGPLFSRLEAGIHMTVEQVTAENDRVVVVASGQAETLEGVPYNNSYCQIFSLRGGLIHSVTEYCDTALVNAVLAPDR
ncbi:nuclear transport factor 2 family protein [Mangrovimicrobium sediminis]|nr:nuclear transport factor 2 family protein [Haliea sp. SAOS-164]